MTIAVIDQGVGMSPEVLDQAMEPYFTTRSKTGGSGLGLAMVYGFVRQSGGEVRITSRLGEGTRVELCFLPSKSDTTSWQAEHEGVCATQ